MSMEKELKEKLLSVVKENLPEVTANELKKFIELAELQKRTLEEAELKIKELNVVIKEKDTLLNEKELLLSKHRALDEREKTLSVLKVALDEREKNLEVDRLNFEMSVYKTYVQNMERNTALLFAHPEAIKIVHSNHNSWIPLARNMGGTMGSYQNPDNVEQHNQHGTTDTTENTLVKKEGNNTSAIK